MAKIGRCMAETRAPEGIVAAGTAHWFGEALGALLRAMPMADVAYAISEHADPAPAFRPAGPPSPCGDLRHKIWVAVHVAGHDRARVTVVRLDNQLERRDPAHGGYKCPRDSAWARFDGWPHPLAVDLQWFDGSAVNANDLGTGNISDTGRDSKTPKANARRAVVVVPAMPSGADCYTAEVELRDIGGAVIDRTKEREIPRRIVQVVHDRAADGLPLLFQKLGAVVRVAHPNWEHAVYAADEMPAAVEAWAGRRMREALETLQPMAYKADLFRVVALHALGGVWADSKLTFVRCLDAPGVLPDKGAFFPMDIGYHGVWNGLLAAPPGDYLMGLAAAMIVRNVDARYYGPDWLAPTGPGLVLRAYETLPAPARLAYTHSALLDGDGVFIVHDRLASQLRRALEVPDAPRPAAPPDAALFPDGYPLVAVHNAEYRRTAPGAGNCHYAPVWLARAAYSEAPCDPATGFPWMARYWRHVAAIGLPAALGATVGVVAMIVLAMHLARRRVARTRAQYVSDDHFKDY